MHLVLRSRPDVVKSWSDAEVARRWMILCPRRKDKDGQPKEPNTAELNAIQNDAVRLASIRSRLSDISWWMRLLCQRIAQRANREDDATGKFWESRYRSVKLIDDEAILACSAYVDLNEVRARLAETIEDSSFSSVQRRIQSLIGDGESSSDENASNPGDQATPTTRRTTLPDSFLAPVEIDESDSSQIGPQASGNRRRASDKGFLNMPVETYLELLDWTARQMRSDKPGSTPADAPPIFARLSIKPAAWLELTQRFGKLFYVIAGQPHRVDAERSRIRSQHYRLPPSARELLSA
jgi:hypothetical protein